jgi:hypothetical protein
MLPLLRAHLAWQPCRWAACAYFLPQVGNLCSCAAVWVFTTHCAALPVALLVCEQRTVEQRSAKLSAAEERCYALEHEVDGLVQQLRAAGGDAPSFVLLAWHRCGRCCL